MVLKSSTYLILLLLLSGCTQHLAESHSLPLNESVILPFTGTRDFETRPGVSGKGTPHRQVTITEEGYVVFSFEQENQADKTLTSESYHAGPYADILKCVFKEWDNEVRFYRITSGMICEVDSNGRQLKHFDCCDAPVINDCDCKSELTVRMQE